MPSFTSSSDRGLRRHIVGVVLLAVVLCLGFEVFARYALAHSTTQKRALMQYRRAVQTKTTVDAVSVLLVGNSLLLAAVDPARLKESTTSWLTIAPLFLEGTSHFDWYYGLRRLFRQGARPRVVAVGLGPSQYLETSVRPDYFPWMLMDLRDVLGVSRDIGLDRTAASSLVLGHFSRFWGTRGVIRSLTLRQAVPDVDRLMFRLNRRGRLRINRDEYETLARPRLERLRDLCAAHGAHLVFVVPPGPIRHDDSLALERTATALALDVIIPIQSGSLPAEYYEDDVHLNEGGAVRFTDALARAFEARLSRFRIRS